MEENKFFRFVWRFNAIAIMALAVLGVASLMLAIASERSRNINRQSNQKQWLLPNNENLITSDRSVVAPNYLRSLSL